MHHMHSHAAAREGGPPVTTLIRADFQGTPLITAAPCSNGLTCSPIQVSARGLGPVLGQRSCGSGDSLTSPT